MKRLLSLHVEKYSAEYSKKKATPKKNLDNLMLLKTKKHSYISKIYFLLIILQLIQVGLNLSFTKKDGFQFQMKSHSNEITIKIQGTGDQYVVYEYFYKCPDSIYLNTVLTNSIGSNCKIINIPTEGETTNTVKLVWNDKLQSLNQLFTNFTHLKEADLSNFDSSSVSHMGDMFYNCPSITYINFSNFNTSLVESMRSLFYECESLTELDLSSFDTSKVTTMSFTFKGCRSLRTLNIASFDTSQVENMEAMFGELFVLESLNVSHFDTSKVTLMSFMFYNCRLLTSINLRNFNTSSVNNMTMMFYNDYNLKELDLSSFDTSKVTTMVDMFTGCSAMTSLDVSNFDTSQVTDMANMFYYCTSLTKLDLSSFNTSNVLRMGQLFRQCTALTSLEIPKFDTSKVTDMNFMFFNCIALTSLDVSNFRTPNALSMTEIFWNCAELTSLDVSKFDTSHITYMYGLFAGCQKLESLDLTNFDTSNVKNMEYIFANCFSLTSLNLSSLDASNADNITAMFYNCQSLSSLDLTNFKTDNVQLMNYLFYNCISLTSVDLSSFRTSQVKDMNNMFNNCKNLKSLDITNFDTSQVTNFQFMFYHCNKLKSLNLTNFRTNSAINLMGLFADCPSLTSLDLSSFDTSHAQLMNAMFFNCQQLKEINIENFDTSFLMNIAQMFQYCYNLEYINFQEYNEHYYYSSSFSNALEGVRNNIVICLGENNENRYIEQLKTVLASKTCHSIYCGDDWRSHIKKIVPENDGCADDCSEYRYENGDYCYSTCPEGANFCTPDPEYIATTNIVTTYNNEEANIKETTNIVTTNNFENFKETTNILTTYKPEGNINLSTNSITTNNIGEGNNIETTNNMITTNNFGENKVINSLNTYFDSSSHLNTEANIITTLIKDNNGEKTTIDIVSSSSPKYNLITDKSDKNLIPSSSFQQTNSINEDGTTEEPKNDKTYLITGENNEAIFEEVKDIMDDYDPSEESIIIEGKDDFIYQITTTENEKDALDGNGNSNNQVSKIDLGECENLLKDFYHLDRSVSLIIVKFEKVTNVSKERTLQYEVYEPFNKTKLNLSVCENTTISVYTPVILSEKLQNLYEELKDKGYDLFNINSAFYQDICTPFNSPDGTDVPLNDRINSYFNNDETLCQPNCKFSDYSIETNLLKCDCDVSNSIIDTKTIKKFTKESVYQSFYETLKFSNYKVLKCYKLAFHINSVTINKGSIMAIIYFSFYFIFLIIYMIKGIKELKVNFAHKLSDNKIISNENSKFIYNNKITEKKDKNIFASNKPEKQVSMKAKPKSKSLRISPNKNIKIKKLINFPPKKKSISKVVPTSRRKSGKQLTRNVEVYSKRYSDKNLLMSNKLTSFKKLSVINQENKIQININSNSKENVPNQEEKLDNFELNNLEYDKAVQLDKRPFLKMYWSILQREHLILFTFFVRNDYNLVYVKLSRFIFLVCTDMALNVFFFSDETMHKMYIDYGKYNFYQQIPQIIYSTIVSQLIQLFLCFLSMTDKHFYEIKKLDFNSRYKTFKIIKCVKIKLTVYFIFTCLMFAFYWYAIACFCAVYVNTQSAFIKDSLCSFGLGLLYPFILYLFPAVLRLIALRATNSRLSFVYALSDIIPFF